MAKDNEGVDSTWAAPTGAPVERALQADSFAAGQKSDGERASSATERWAADQLATARLAVEHGDPDVARIEVPGVSKEVYYTGLSGSFPKLWANGERVKPTAFGGLRLVGDDGGTVRLKQSGFWGYPTLKLGKQTLYTAGSPPAALTITALGTFAGIWLGIGGIGGAIGGWFAGAGLASLLRNSENKKVAYTLGVVLALAVIAGGAYFRYQWTQQVGYL